MITRIDRAVTQIFRNCEPRHWVNETVTGQLIESMSTIRHVNYCFVKVKNSANPQIHYCLPFQSTCVHPFFSIVRVARPLVFCAAFSR